MIGYAIAPGITVIVSTIPGKEANFDSTKADRVTGLERIQAIVPTLLFVKEFAMCHDHRSERWKDGEEEEHQYHHAG